MADAVVRWMFIWAQALRNFDVPMRNLQREFLVGSECGRCKNQSVAGRSHTGFVWFGPVKMLPSLWHVSPDQTSGSHPKR